MEDQSDPKKTGRAQSEPWLRLALFFLIMANFLTDQDLFNRFGTENVTSWSDLNRTGQLDSVRMTAAKDYGEAQVQNRFARSGYLVPFTFTSDPKDPQVIDWMVIFASRWLYSSRNIRNVENATDEKDRFSTLIARVEKEIRSVLANSMNVNLVRTDTPNPTGPVCVI